MPLLDNPAAAEPAIADNPLERGTEDAAVSAMARLLDKESPETPQDAPPPPEDSPAPTQDAPEADPDNAPEESDKVDPDAPADAALVEVEYEGKPYQVPAEIKDALMRHSDYSKKTAEVAEARKAAESAQKQAEEFHQNSAAYAKSLAQLQIVDAQLAQLDQTDWQRLRAEDPTDYNTRAIDRQNLLMQRQQIQTEAQGIDQRFQAERNQLMQKLIEEGQAELPRRIPGWNTQVREAVKSYGVTQGFTPDELATVVDARAVAVLNKARLYDELQAKKPEVQKRVQAVPRVLAPGAARNKQADAMSEAAARLKRTGNREDAVRLMEMRLR